MKKCIFTQLLVFSLVQAHAAYIPILNVSVSPLPPSIGEDILVYVDGEAGSPPLSYSSQVDINADLIVLDIYFNVFGVSTVITPWDHVENIGPLDSGVYNLTVNTYNNPGGIGELTDSSQTDFTVIPEPSTVTLLGVGGLLVYCRRKRVGRLPEMNSAGVLRRMR